MKIHLSCPTCRVQYSVSSQFGGKIVNCKKCGTEIIIPIITEQAEPTTTSTTSSKTQQNIKPSQKGRHEIPQRYRRQLKKGVKQSTNKVLIATTFSVVAILFIVLGLKFGYNQYKIFQFKNKLEEAIGRDAGITETILKVESDASNMNYLELFDLCKKSIEDRTNLIIELRGLFPYIKYELKEDLIEFLNEENRLIRAKREFYKRQLTYTSKVSLIQEYMSDYSDRPTSYYSLRYALKRAENLRSELIESITAIITTADDFKSAYLNLLKIESTLARKMSKENLKFVPIFKQYEPENMNLANTTKDDAEKLRKTLL